MEKRFQLKTTLLFFPLLFLLFACANDARNTTSIEDSQMMEADMATEEMAQMDEAAVDDSGSGDITLDLGDKIIENAYLSYETTDFDAAIDYVDAQVTEFQGAIEHSSRSQGSYPSQDGYFISMSIRIPQEQLEGFIDSLNAFNQLYILSEEIGRQDVTQHYRDNETRIAVLEEEETALRELMQEQGTLEELLLIRQRLTEVISEREIFENQNQAYDEQVAYSTVQLSIQQTDRASSQDLGGFWNRITNAIVDSFYSFIAVTQNLVISLIYFMPFLIILGIIGWIAYRFYKNRKNTKL